MLDILVALLGCFCITSLRRPTKMNYTPINHTAVKTENRGWLSRTFGNATGGLVGTSDAEVAESNQRAALRKQEAAAQRRERILLAGQSQQALEGASANYGTRKRRAALGSGLVPTTAGGSPTY